MFSIAGLLFKPLNGVIGSLEIAGWRSVVVFLTLLVIRAVSGKSITKLPISFSKWQLFSATCLASQSIFFSIAILISSTADTFLITNAAPLYMVFWQAVFDKKYPTKVEILIIIIALFGLTLFFIDSLSHTNISGLVASIITGFAFAGHIYAQGRVGKEGRLNGDPLTMGSIFLGSLIAACIGLTINSLFLSTQIFSIPPWAILCVVGLGIFQFAIPMLLWAKAIPHIPSLLAAFMPTLVAVWAPCWTYFLLSEPFPGATAIIGAVIVHFAVLFAALRKLKK